MNFKRLSIVLLSVLLIAVLGPSLILGQARPGETEPVVYYGDEVTTFTEIFEKGLLVYCTDSGPDIVRCYDTQEEANAEFARVYPDVYQRSLLNPSASVNDVHSRSVSDYFSLYASSLYVNFIKDIYYTDTSPPHMWSVMERGDAAMQFYKGIPGNNCDGVSWVIGESHETLGDGWGGGGAKCIQWLGP